MFNVVKVLFKSNKIHKLQLTNKFNELLFALLNILFGKLSSGAKTKELEEAFRLRFGAKKALIFPHARIALHFILKSMNFEKGSEILMAPLTIADMVNSIHTLGLKPVFVDIESDTFCIDPQKLKDAITEKSRAILVTYLFGVVPDIDKIKRIADEYGLKIIEDCSQCFDASYNGKKIGTFGDVAFFSLTNFKVCSSLFGGMIITNNETLADSLVKLRSTDLLPPRKRMLIKLAVKDLIYAVFFSRWVFSYFTFFLVFVLEHIDPRITYRLYSGNIKVLLGGFENKLYEKFPDDYLTQYTDIQARVGLKSLERAEYVTSARIRNGERLRRLFEAIPSIRIPAITKSAINVYWRFPVVTEDIKGLKKFLLLHGIDSSASYLTLCSSEPGFEIYHTSMPKAEIVKNCTLIVEVNESLSEKDIDFTALLARSYFENN
ncbi:MAG: DegT/DnrJ/EryC1/StrS family aminotransferase [Candidatus Omnitrophota bacterium]|nr:DegT/DnrJ/EryC1/StrS family aminotransferase [Candidatus Omnitrophota bacterium]